MPSPGPGPWRPRAGSCRRSPRRRFDVLPLPTLIREIRKISIALRLPAPARHALGWPPSNAFQLAQPRAQCPIFPRRARFERIVDLL
eukprot:3651866-Pyramimonas_sp.AAC.1